MASKVKQHTAEAPASEEQNTAEDAVPRRGRGPSANSVTLIGRLVADPELRYTQTGLAVARMRIAINGPQDTQFYDVVAWRRTAEATAEYLGKGRLVYVEGQLHSRTWVGRDDVTRYAVEVTARRVVGLSAKTA